MLAPCPPSNKWVPGDNTEEIKAAKKGTGNLRSHANGSEIEVNSIGISASLEPFIKVL